MMLKYNVVNAEMFCYIHAFNKSTWEEELDFLLGTEDKIFMMSCNPSLRGKFYRTEYRNYLSSSK